MPTVQCDPATLGLQSFHYIDIASIDRGRKEIADTKVIQLLDAPSRARKLVNTGDVLVSTVRPNLNAVAQVPQDLDGQIASTGFTVLRANPKILNSRYLFYRTCHTEFVEYLVTNATGASYPAVSDNIVRRAPLPLPTLKEQARIVELLGEADSLRRLSREADAKAVRILPSLFLKMFGDPVSNPMGWATDRLENLFDVVGGGTPSTSVPEFWDGDIPWVSPKDMKCDVIRDTEDHISQAAVRNSTTKLVKRGSVLIVYRSGILAHTFPVAFSGCELAINQDLKALNSKGEVSNDFIYGLFVACRSLALSYVKKGATVHNIDGSRFMSMQIPKPSDNLQRKFSSCLVDLSALNQVRANAASRVEQMFSLLLQKGFNGTLTADWRQAHMQKLLAEMTEQAKLLNLPAQ